MGVRQTGRDPDLPKEPLAAHGRRQLRVEHFNRHAPPMFPVFGQVHGRHPAAPERGLDGIAIGQRVLQAVENGHVDGAGVGPRNLRPEAGPWPAGA